MKRLYRKNVLLKALKEEGLPFTTQNFVTKYERIFCQKADCPHRGKAYLVSPRRETGRKDRVYAADQVKSIIKNAKNGWFTKHWHWFPEE